MARPSKQPRVVVISGSTSGIGKELCRLYRAAGDTVIGFSRGESEPTGIAVDVTDTQAVRAAVDAVARKYGRIDTVIANAGGGLSGATELIPSEHIRNQFDLNCFGAAELIRAALKHMRAGGNAVLISSACALFALPYRAYYCASKSAATAIAFGLYMELKDKGIRVCSVCPGDIKTSFTANRVKIDDGGERYGDEPSRSAKKIDSREHKRMALEPAVRKIYKCCKKCRKPLYIVGAKYKFLNFMSHILPKRLFLNLTAKMFVRK